MFILIEDPGEAIDKAIEFLNDNDFPIPNSVEDHLPIGELLPCLLSFFKSHRSVGAGTVPTLGCHVASKDLAKCLVYDKTNKLNNSNIHFMDWVYIKAESLKEFLDIKNNLYGNLILTESPGFKDTLFRCIENSEPFLYHLKASRTVTNRRAYDQDVLNLTQAKNLVYYRKNREFVNKLSAMDMSKLIDRVMKNDPTLRKKDVNVINFLMKELKTYG